MVGENVVFKHFVTIAVHTHAITKTYAFWLKNHNGQSLLCTLSYECL